MQFCYKWRLNDDVFRAAILGMLDWLKKYWAALVLIALLIAILDATLSSLLTCHPASNNPGNAADAEQVKDECTALSGPVLLTIKWLATIAHKYEGLVTAAFTIVLAVFTARLWYSTEKLWHATNTLADDAKKTAKAQSDDTRLLQRAYVGVLANGIQPFATDNSLIGCNVNFHNAGNLPARNVRWELHRQTCTDSRRTSFPLTNALEGGIVIPPKITAPKGTLALPTKEFDDFIVGATSDNRWLYVWGQIKYLDGFEVERFTKFCHRYNLAAAERYRIGGPAARYHEHGNDAD